MTRFSTPTEGHRPLGEPLKEKSRADPEPRPQSRRPSPFRWLLGWLLIALITWITLYRTGQDLQVGLTIAVSLGGTAAVWLGIRAGGLPTGTRILRWMAPTASENVSPKAAFDQVLVWTGIIALGYLTVVNLQSAGASSFDLGQALADPSHAYIERQRVIAMARGAGGPSLLFHLASVFLYVLPAAIMLRWKSLGAITRWLGVSAIVCYGVSWLVVGTLKGFIETAILLAVSLSVVRSRRIRSGRRRLRPGAILALVVIGAGVAALAAHTLGGRLLEVPNHRQPPEVLASTMGAQAAVGLEGFIGYFAQGHSGLGASLDQAFVWTAGSGSSEGLQSLAPWLANEEEHRQAYPYRAEIATGWPAKERWQTIYPWLASDLTFAGSIVFVGLLAFLAGAAWVIAAGRRGILATAIFSQLYLILVYIPLNNGPISSTSNLVAAFLLWICAGAYSLELARRRSASMYVAHPPDLNRAGMEG